MAGGNPAIYWLDNERVLFIGHNRIKPEPGGNIVLALLQWHIGKGLTLLREGVDSLCYRPGQIRYSVKDGKTKGRIFYQGQVGQELQIKPKGNDQLNCDWTYESSAKLDNRSTQRLLPGHGELYLGPAYGKESLDNTPVVHRANGDHRETELPFGRRETGGGIRYYEFRGAYFVRLAYFDPIRKITSSWPSGSLQRAYWLWPDGRTEQLEFPSDMGDPQPSQAGVVYRITAIDESKNGIYLYRDHSKRMLIVRGHVTDMAVSPDGCKLAFSHASNRKSYLAGPDNRRTLKIAELCPGRTR